LQQAFSGRGIQPVSAGIFTTAVSGVALGGAHIAARPQEDPFLSEPKQMSDVVIAQPSNSTPIPGFFDLDHFLRSSPHFDLDQRPNGFYRGER
jgi:hypothetical protein